MVVAAEETGGGSPLALLYDMNRLLGVVCSFFFFCSVVSVMSRSQEPGGADVKCVSPEMWEHAAAEPTDCLYNGLSIYNLRG